MDNSYTLELFLQAHLTSRLSVGNSRWLVWNEEHWEVYEQHYRQKVKRVLVTHSLSEALKTLGAANA